MGLDIRERVVVAAVFSDGGMRPVWFLWHGRKYPVSEVTYTWESREGLARLRHFSVSSGPNVYALAYNPVDTAWELRGVEEDWRG